jgi:Cys-tRNA(Pro)/Cys-tRNA(Cys) deacylase
MTIRNNVTRLLDANNIDYQAIELPSAEKRSAIKTAELLGAPPEQVFKTIVTLRMGRGKPILAVLPGPTEVDLKSVASIVQEKKVRLSTQAEAEKITSLQSGGISALALLNHGFEIVLDEFALVFDDFYVSGGQRGLSILIPTPGFIKLTNAKIADISI